MTPQEERGLHALAVTLAQLTSGAGWSRSADEVRIKIVLRQMSEHIPLCDCQRNNNVTVVKGKVR